MGKRKKKVVKVIFPPEIFQRAFIFHFASPLGSGKKMKMEKEKVLKE